MNNKEAKHNNLFFGYRRELDGLRAIAVIAVIINHFNKEILPSGYLGVDIFFVLSGYVITSSIYRRHNNNFKEFILGFYKRRIKRIVPALLFFVLVMSVIICLFNPKPEISLITGLRSLIGFSNIYLFNQSTDYFATQTEYNVFAHTWSLGIEEQFYFIFPFLIWLTGFGRKTKNGSKNLLLVISILIFISLVLFIHYYPFNRSAAYFLIQNRFWEIAFGCLTFLYNQNNNSFTSDLKKFPPFLSLIAIFSLMFLPVSKGILATILTVSFTSIFISSLNPKSILYPILSSPKLVFIGSISYSLYLWHWGILSISRWTIGIFWWTVPFQIILIFFAAYFSFYFVENPIRNNKNNFFNSKIIYLGLISLSFSSLAIFFTEKNSLYKNIYLGNKNKTKLSWEMPENDYLKKCHVADKYDKELMEECLSRKYPNRKTIFLLGDSHARNFLGTLKTVFNEDEVLYLTMGHGCTFQPSTITPDWLDEITACTPYRDESSDYILKNSKEGDTVFIGSRLVDTPERQTDEYLELIVNFAKKLNTKNTRVVILDSVVPPPGLLSVLCDKEFFRPVPYDKEKSCTLSREQVNQRFEKFDGLVKKFLQNNQNLYYASLREGLCRSNKCDNYTSNGNFIWIDWVGHITDKASRDLAPLLKERLLKQDFSF